MLKVQIEEYTTDAYMSAEKYTLTVCSTGTTSTPNGIDAA